MLLRIGSILLLALLAVTAAADSWTWKDNVTTWRFGDGLRVDAITDKIDRGNAKQYVKIVRGSQVLATINGVGFNTLAASPEENLFVGLSNLGLPGTAVVVFDEEGRLLLYVRHGNARFDYCSESITIDRTWHGSEPKDIQFDNESRLGGISLLDCRGNRVKLLKIVSEAYERGHSDYEESKEFEEWKARRQSSKK